MLLDLWGPVGIGRKGRRGEGREVGPAFCLLRSIDCSEVGRL